MMGYTTDFEGAFTITPPLPDWKATSLQEFCEERHDGEGTPGIWCQWTTNNEGTKLFWDQNEKFYNYIEWLEWLITSSFLQGHTLSGTVAWYGENRDDMGLITISKNQVQTELIPGPDVTF